MLETSRSIDADGVGEAVPADVARVVRLMPPLWDLPNYVAVNPFLGFCRPAVRRGRTAIGDGLGARVLPGVEFYRDGGTRAHSARTTWPGRPAGRGQPRRLLRRPDRARPSPARPAGRCCPSPSGRTGGTAPIGTTRLSARSHAGARSMRRAGGPRWRLADDGAGPFASWREAAAGGPDPGDRRPARLAALGRGSCPTRRRGDRSDAGTAGPRPRRPRALPLSAARRTYGWASFFRRRSWQASDGDESGRAGGPAGDPGRRRRRRGRALARPGGDRGEPGHGRDVEDESKLLVFQEALEDGYAQRPARQLAPPPPVAGDRDPPCRRFSASTCGPSRCVATWKRSRRRSRPRVSRGSSAWASSGRPRAGGARCPVLLKPAVAPAAGRRRARRGPAAIKHLQAAPAASFSFVEMLGPGLRASAWRATPWLPRPARRPAADAVAVRTDGGRRGAGHRAGGPVDLAAGILKNMGLRAPFARLVLLCGHDGPQREQPARGRAGLRRLRRARRRDQRPGRRGAAQRPRGPRGAARAGDGPPRRHAVPRRPSTTRRSTGRSARPRPRPGRPPADLDAPRAAGSCGAGGGRGPSGRPAWAWPAAPGPARAACWPARPRLVGGPARMGAGPQRRVHRRPARRAPGASTWAAGRSSTITTRGRPRRLGPGPDPLGPDGRRLLDQPPVFRLDGGQRRLRLRRPRRCTTAWGRSGWSWATAATCAPACRSSRSTRPTAGGTTNPCGCKWWWKPPQARIDAVLSDHPAVRDLVENGWVRLFALDPEGPGASLRVPEAAGRTPATGIPARAGASAAPCRSRSEPDPRVGRIFRPRRGTPANFAGGRRKLDGSVDLATRISRFLGRRPSVEIPSFPPIALSVAQVTTRTSRSIHSSPPIMADSTIGRGRPRMDPARARS